MEKDIKQIKKEAEKRGIKRVVEEVKRQAEAYLNDGDTHEYMVLLMAITDFDKEIEKEVLDTLLQDI